MEKQFFGTLKEVMKRVNASNGDHMFYITNKLLYNQTAGQSGYVDLQVDRYKNGKLKSIWVMEDTIAMPLMRWDEKGIGTPCIPVTALVAGIFEVTQ